LNKLCNAYCRSNLNDSTFDRSLIRYLTKMVDKHNVLTQSFRKVREFIIKDAKSDFGCALFLDINSKILEYTILHHRMKLQH